MTVYLLCMVLFAIGIYCMMTKTDLIKIIIGLGISEYAVNLMFILLGYKMNGRAPILEKGQIITDIVDPLPQALVLTSIVIGLAVTALLAALAIRLYAKYGTFDISKIRRLRG